MPPLGFFDTCADVGCSLQYERAQIARETEERERCEKVTLLTKNDVTITPELLQALSVTIEKNKGTKVVLNWNCFDSPKACLEGLRDVLKENRVTTLRMIDDGRKHNWDALAMVLKENTVVTLDLTENNLKTLTVEEWQAFSEMITTAGISDLCLKGNGLGEVPSNVLPAFCLAIRNVAKLDLSSNKFNSSLRKHSYLPYANLEFMLEVLSQSEVISLNISGNELTVEQETLLLIWQDRIYRYRDSNRCVTLRTPSFH